MLTAGKSSSLPTFPERRASRWAPRTVLGVSVAGAPPVPYATIVHDDGDPATVRFRPLRTRTALGLLGSTLLAYAPTEPRP